MLDDLATLLPEWRVRLRARNLAPGTVNSYLTSGQALLDYLNQAGMPTRVGALSRKHLESWLAELTETVSAATVARHYRSIQQLFRWLVDDGELTSNPMARMRSPLVPEQPVEVLTVEELARLLGAWCLQGELLREPAEPRSSGCCSTAGCGPVN